MSLSQSRLITLASCAALGLLIMTGCAQVPTYTTEQEQMMGTKEFATPSEGKAGVYVYREDTISGSALYKDVYIDGLCVGETAPGVYFYTEVEGDKEHVIATESEFSPNQLTVFTKTGKNYFVEQFIKWGVFVGGADVRLVDEIEGKAEIEISKQAIPGTCSNL